MTMKTKNKKVTQSVGFGDSAYAERKLWLHKKKKFKLNLEFLCGFKPIKKLQMN